MYVSIVYVNKFSADNHYLLETRIINIRNIKGTTDGDGCSFGIACIAIKHTISRPSIARGCRRKTQIL